MTDTFEGPGQTGIDVSVMSGEFLMVSGGSATGAAVAFGGQVFVSSGGSVFDTSLGGYEVLSAGGTATSTSVNNVGAELVYSGGTASETTLNHGGDQAVYSGGSAIGTTVSNGGIELVYSSGNTTGSVLDNGGLQQVYGGGVASNTTAASGGFENVSAGGVTSGTTVASGGTELVNSGASAIGTTVSSGGLLLISSGGTVTGTVIETGGFVLVLPGGSAVQTSGSVISSGVVVVQDGVGVVDYANVINGSAIGLGVTDYVYAGGHANASEVAGGGSEVVLSSGTASGAVIGQGGNQYVGSDGTTTGTEVDSGGFQTVSSGGTASATAVEFGGNLVVLSTGTTNGTVVSAGGQVVVSSGATTSGTHLNGGFEYVSGGTAISAVVSAGGREVIYPGGTASGVVVSNGGTLGVFAGGVDAFSVISSGGTEFVLSNSLSHDTVVSNGGTQKVFADATASGTVVSNGGTENVLAGGTIEAITINGGQMEIHGGGPEDQGSITFAGSGSITIDAGTPASTIVGFGNGDTVDFASIAPGSVTIVPVGGNTVIGGVTFAGSFPLTGPGSLVVGTDGGGGTKVTAVAKQIVNLGAKLAISPASVTKPEGNSGTTPFTFTVTRSGVTTGVSSANWTVAGVGGLPANAADFAGGVLPSGTVIFAPGETSKTITVGVAGDTTVEFDERFNVTLSGVLGATITTAGAVGAIQNDDTGLAIGALSATKPEGNAGTTPFTFTVARSGLTTGASSAHWSVAGVGGLPANAADFTGGVLPSGTVNFAAGQTSQTITVNVAGDTTIEFDERFNVTLSGAAGATITTPSAIGTIQNDDTALAISPLSVTKLEGNSGTTPFTFTVTRSGLLTGASSVNWTVAGVGGLAANAADFTGGVLPSGTVNFAPGQTSQTISVGVAGDTTVEYDERFSVTLSAPAGATITTPSAVGTIQNDDTGLAINALSATKAEGNSGTTPFTFTVARSGLLTGSSSATWSVAGVGGLAANAADFTGGVLPSGTVNFAPGQASATITVGVAGDTTVEFDERFNVTLSGAAGATITTASAIGTIQNDDTALAISPLSATKPEGNSGATPFTFTVTRSGLTTAASSANWSVAGVGGLAANAADFTGGVLPSGTVSFAPGVTSQTITVNIAGDTTVEPDERFNVTLSGAAGATITTASAVGTIQNDDTGLAIGALSATKTEGNSGTTPFTFTVARSGLTTGASSVNWSVAGVAGLPANAADFTGGVFPTGTVNFAAGQTSATVSVGVAGDTTLENNERFVVTLSGATGAGITAATAVGTINNDDTATNAVTNALSSAGPADLFVIGGADNSVTSSGGDFLFAENMSAPAATDKPDFSAISTVADAPFNVAGMAAFSGTAGEPRWADLGMQGLIPGAGNGVDPTIITALPGPAMPQLFGH